MKVIKLFILLTLLLFILGSESSGNRISIEEKPEEAFLSDLQMLEIEKQIEELFPLSKLGIDFNIQEFIEKMLKYITSIPGIKYIPDVVFQKIIDPIIAKVDKLTNEIKEKLKPEDREFKIEYIYPYVEHKIVTEDGYILTAWNFNLDIVKEKQGEEFKKDFMKELPGKGKVIMVQHGLLDDSYTWITLKEKAIVTLLIRAGYDVWLTNNRGNIYSWEHIDPKMNSRNIFNAYWDFSFDEIAKYDLPANINYILKHTGKESLYYMGHSQGTIQFYISYTYRSEYMKSKVKKFASIGTVFSLFNSVSFL